MAKPIARHTVKIKCAAKLRLKYINELNKVHHASVFQSLHFRMSVPSWSCHHDDVIKWKHFPLYWPFVRGIHRSPVNSPHKGQWRGALMFSLICVWINSWVNNGEAGDLGRNRAHHGVTVTIKFRCEANIRLDNSYSGRLRDDPDSKVHGANMGPIWVLSVPGGPHEPCYQCNHVADIRRKRRSCCPVGGQFLFFAIFFVKFNRLKQR